ncbi:MAG: hypothetical protein KC464_11065, partial [Myxococcales bacterium]|nr:hypothetical protein [Myxococcales bacterium]
MVIRLVAQVTRPIALVAVGALGLVAACSFDPGGVGGDGGIADSDGAIVDAAPGDGVPPSPDATPDATPIDGATCVPWAAVNVDPCDGALPAAAALTIGNGRSQYDTDTGQLTVPGGLTSAPPSALLDQTVAGPKARVVNLSAFTVVSGGTLAVIGSHPLIVVVHG